MKKKFKAKPQGRKPFSQPVANGNGNGSQGSNRRGVRGVMNQKQSTSPTDGVMAA